jgi:translation initiation factor 4B
MDNQWRARMRPDQAKEASNPESPAAAHAAPAAPATRPKLNLQKRTVSDAVSSPTAAAAGDSKASPFGAARPIDTAAREKQVEEKRQLAIRQKKEADDKAKAEKAEKARIAKEQGKEEKPADSNKDAVDTPQGGKNFEILRRAGGDDAGMTADQEAEEPTVAPAEAPKEPAANGKWRSAAPTEEAAADEGWSTVSAKPRNPRRGQAGRGVA